MKYTYFPPSVSKFVILLKYLYPLPRVESNLVLVLRLEIVKCINVFGHD